MSIFFSFLWAVPLQGFHVTQLAGSFLHGGQHAHGNDGKCGSMFVAIISSPGNVEQRNYTREMWRDANSSWGNVLPKYVICTRNGVTADLRRENDIYRDLLFMDECDEGYFNGLLTRKVATAMKTFLRDYSSYVFFMKIDDDTFISPHRLCDVLLWRKDEGMDNMNTYMGVFAEGPHEALHGPSAKHVPIRDPASPWYEPESKFSGDVYPLSAKGGTGYILSRRLVEPIIETGIADAHELNNEDKAVGVWVHELSHKGFKIEIANIHGTDGYPEHSDSIVTSGAYASYPHLLHHHLPGKAIACLHRIDVGNNPEEHIDACFQ